MNNIFSHLLTNPKTDLQRQAQESFKNLTLPTTRQEHWKYTRLGRLQHLTFVKNHQIDLKELEKITWFSDYHLLFINGKLQEQYTVLPKNCHLERNTTEAFDLNLGLFNNLNTFFNTANTAFTDDALILKVADHQIIDQAIHILYLQQGNLEIIQPKLSILLGKNSELTCIQEFKSDQAQECLTNIQVQIELQEDAKMQNILIQHEDLSAFHIQDLRVKQEKNSFFKQHHFLMGGALVRNNIHILCANTHTETELNGIFVGKNEQVLDNHLFLEHAKEQQNSYQLYKGVLTDKARGVFNGKIKIYPNAQKINGFQSNKNILLSENAIIDTKPELEIEADDVKCSHGTTTGQIDKNALFYLQARGLDRKTAYQLLLEAFFNECLNKLNQENVKNYLSQAIQHHLD